MRRALLALLALAATVIAVASASAATYPDPPFDFAHPGSPHHPLLTTASGNDPRPLLVILAVYSDYPETVSSAQARQRFFGPFPSVADYYRSQSFGRYDLTPATESEGTANDGVIRAPMGALADIQTAGGDLGGPFGRQAALAADQWIDFASYDANGDDFVDARELAIVVLTDFDGLSNCGGTRTITPVEVDGVNLSGRQYSFDFGLENNITHIHELAHQTFATQDQFYTAGTYDVTGPTCSAAQLYFSFNSWYKLHLGWITPQVVARDGYYDVPDWTGSGRAFLLYDPDRGTDDYLLVENRQRGGYDQSLADTGLIVWRIDDTAYDDQTGRRLYDIVLPGGGQTPQFYGGGSTDAFDPSDRFTPQRDVSPAWADGTASRLAVRAIGSTGPTVRAYFDVRGPGVLVDALDFDAVGSPVARPRVMPGVANPVSFRVMNTGESDDSFRFTLADLPSGWTASTVTRSLGAGEQATVTVDVTPAAGAAVDTVHSLRATGASVGDPTVASDSPLSLVTSPGLSIADAAPVTEGDTGTRPAQFSLRLSSPVDEPIEAQVSTLDGSATQPADYTPVATTVTFAPGDTQAGVSVPVVGDRVDEPNESFSVRIASSRAVVSRGQASATIVDDDRNGAFTCRAIGASLGTNLQVVANPADNPCADDSRDVAPVRIASGLLGLTLDRVQARTDVTPNDQAATPAAGDSGAASVESQRLTLSVGLVRISLLGVSASARAACTGSGAPALSSQSEVRGLTVNGQTLARVTGPLTIPLGVATLRLNQTIAAPGRITQRALVLDPLVGPDIVIGEASAGFVGTPAHPAGHPCSD